MKYFSLFSIALLFSLSSAAQFKKETFFLKENGKEVNDIDSADFVRIIDEPDAESKLYNLYEHYKSGAKKTIGKVSSFKYGLTYDGLLSEFYESGAKKSIKNYQKEELIGDAFFYHENGKLERHELFEQVDSKEEQAKVKKERQKLLFKQDSLGNVMVKDGNGYDISRTDLEKDTLIEEGNYKDGFKDRVWKGRYVSGKSSYVEEYNLGSFVEGVSTVSDSIYRYKEIFITPKYEGGIEKFYKFLGKKVKYPKDAAKKSIKGTVVVNFVVEKDGAVTEAKIIESVYPSIDDEVIRVILLSPKWNNAFHRGVPVRVRYNIPVKFSL